MRETNTSMTEYLKSYNTVWEALMAYEARPESTLREYKNRSVRTTWAVSFEGVKRKNEDAAKLLQIWSYLDNRDIWFEIFNNEMNSDLEAWSNPPAWFRRVVCNKVAFKGVAAILLDYSFIEAKQDSESYGVHPVVHEWCRKTVSTDTKPELAFLAISSVGFGVQRRAEGTPGPTRRRLLQHASLFSQSLMNMLEETLESEQAVELYVALSNLGRLYQYGGPRMWVDAEAAYRRAISGLENLQGLHHRSTLSTQVCLAALYSDQKKLADAEALDRRVLAIQTEKLGLDHKDTLDSMFYLANDLSQIDKLAEAENLYQFLLMRSQHLSFNKDFLFAALGNLYMQQGKLTESEAMYLQAIAGYKTYLETDHPAILRARHCLGYLYNREGRLVEAEATIHQALEGMKEYFGVDGDETLKAMKLLGSILGKQGKLAEAETAFKQALAGHRHVLGPEHESTLLALQNLALCYKSQGKFTEAEPLLLHCLDTSKHIPDDQKTSTQLNCINSLGIIYARQRRFAEAEVMFQQALSGHRRVSGLEHETTLRTLQNLRICYERQGKFDEAAALSSKEIDIKEFDSHDPTIST